MEERIECDIHQYDKAPPRTRHVLINSLSGTPLMLGVSMKSEGQRNHNVPESDDSSPSPGASPSISPTECDASRHHVTHTSHRLCRRGIRDVLHLNVEQCSCIDPNSLLLSAMSGTRGYRAANLASSEARTFLNSYLTLQKHWHEGSRSPRETRRVMIVEHPGQEKPQHPGNKRKSSKQPRSVVIVVVVVVVVVVVATLSYRCRAVRRCRFFLTLSQSVTVALFVSALLRCHGLVMEIEFRPQKPPQLPSATSNRSKSPASLLRRLYSFGSRRRTGLCVLSQDDRKAVRYTSSLLRLMTSPAHGDHFPCLTAEAHHSASFCSFDIIFSPMYIYGR
ncbi:unnamed protein product [Soboliphyme baturini]|uniref:TGF_BETA_2 domain-containing protein n=1 Tax=Soboliphyme baturini TaxID=241478 RepID=A0A183IY64_9BILA|nr:unnamed protein product [Soboliphyme baturini]